MEFSVFRFSQFSVSLFWAIWSFLAEFLSFHLWHKQLQCYGISLTYRDRYGLWQKGFGAVDRKKQSWTSEKAESGSDIYGLHTLLDKQSCCACCNKWISDSAQHTSLKQRLLFLLGQEVEGHTQPCSTAESWLKAHGSQWGVSRGSKWLWNQILLLS